MVDAGGVRYNCAEQQLTTPTLSPINHGHSFPNVKSTSISSSFPAFDRCSCIRSASRDIIYKFPQLPYKTFLLR